MDDILEVIRMGVTKRLTALCAFSSYLLVNRKKTHTNQYIHFTSHHLLHHKLGDVRTLLDRCENLVSDEEDRKREKEYIRNVLQQNSYPQWTIRSVEKKLKEKKRECEEKNPTRTKQKER